jgi:hypothetical protein
MRNGTFVAAVAVAGLLGLATGLVLAPAPAARGTSILVEPPEREDLASEAATARSERDLARAEADALRNELDRERAARRAIARPPTITGSWYHSVDGRPASPMEFREGGELTCGDRRARWTLEGRVLRMSWPSGDAPGGAWEDLCFLSEDGAAYDGRNNVGSTIHGSRRPE